MSQLPELTQFLLAAGGATPIGDSEEGVNLLYIEGSTLILKHWTGTTFSSQEPITTSVLEGSPAAYLITSTAKRVVCISPSFILQSLIHDGDAGKWVKEEAIGSRNVHPRSKLAGSIGEDGQQDLFFQDPSKQLIHLDREWKPTTLPVNAVEGTPLAASVDEEGLKVFYVSASDNQVHYAAQKGDGWGDDVFAEYAFDDKEVPKRFVVSLKEDKYFEVFVLTEQREILQISADGQKVSLEMVDVADEGMTSMARYSGARSERIIIVNNNININVGRRRFFGRRFCW